MTRFRISAGWIERGETHQDSRNSLAGISSSSPSVLALPSRGRREPPRISILGKMDWIPAFAGMTSSPLLDDIGLGEDQGRYFFKGRTWVSAPFSTINPLFFKVKPHVRCRRDTLQRAPAFSSYPAIFSGSKFQLNRPLPPMPPPGFQSGDSPPILHPVSHFLCILGQRRSLDYTDSTP